MKKIIFSNYDDIKNPYYGGGGALAIHETAKRLTRDFNVKVITGKYPNSKNENIDGVTYKRIGASFGGPKVGQIIYQICLPPQVLKENFDVWFESFTPPISTSFLPFFTHKPVVGLVHMLSGIDMKRKYKLPFDFFENIGLSNYKNFIVTSPSIKDKILKNNKTAKIDYIPNGTFRFKKNNLKKKNQILFLGRIEINQKGIDLLLDAFKKVVRGTNLKLVIAGSGERKQIQILKKQIKNKKLDNYVDFVGKVNDGQKAKLFEQSICLVVPSRFETFSLVALESLANGLPLIHFDINNLSWIPTDTSIRVKQFNTNKLSNAIKLLSKDKKLQERLILNGKKYSKKFSWSKNSTQYKQFVQNLI